MYGGLQLYRFLLTWLMVVVVNISRSITFQVYIHMIFSCNGIYGIHISLIYFFSNMWYLLFAVPEFRFYRFHFQKYDEAFACRISELPFSGFKLYSDELFSLIMVQIHCRPNMLSPDLIICSIARSRKNVMLYLTIRKLRQ